MKTSVLKTSKVSLEAMNSLYKYVCVPNNKTMHSTLISTHDRLHILKW